MSAIDLVTLRSRVRQLGNYENSARFTDAFLTDQINAALFELYELLSNTHEGYFDIETTLATVASTATVSLPADFWRMRGLDVSLNGRYMAMRQIAIAERNDYGTSGQPRAYRIGSGGTRGQVTIYPTPDAAYTLRLVYEPTRTPLAADADTVEDWNGWADYVVTGALLRCDEREMRPIGERLAKLDRIRKRIVEGATERRAAEPEYLVPRSQFDTDYFWNGGD